jgi:hypothetical protein
VGVAVYPRLGELLRSSNLTVDELERQIEEHYGLPVDSESLRRLADGDPIQRADLEIAGAAAAILGVGLGELFTVEAALVLAPEEPVLDPEQSRRLADLLDEQDRRALSAAEQREVDALVAENNRRLHERALPKIAAEWGVSVEQARQRLRAELDEAIRWWEAFQADPKRQRAVVARARRRRARRARGAD